MAPNDTVVTVMETPESRYGADEKSVKHLISAHPSPEPYQAQGFSSQPSDRWQDKDDEGELTEIGLTWQKLRKNVIVRYVIYIVPVAIVLAIPIILFATIYKDSRIRSTFKDTKMEPVFTSNVTSIVDGPSSTITNIYNNTASSVFEETTTEVKGGIRLLGLFIWIEVVWVLLWIGKLFAQFVPILFQTVAGALRTGIRRYSLVLKAVEIPLSLFFWAIFSLASHPIIYTFDQEFYHKYGSKIHWLNVVFSVSRASVGVAALYLVQKLLIQMLSVSYHGKKMYDTIKELGTLSRAIETMYDVSRRRYPDDHPSFREEDLDIHDTRGWRKDKYGRRTGLDTTANFVSALTTTGDKVTSVLGYMASDIAGKQVLMPTASGPIVEAALERTVGAEALARRIWNAFTNFGSSPLDETAIKQMFGPGCEAQAAYIFAKVDSDENGDITMEEMVDICRKVAYERQTIWEGASNVKDAIKVLDRVLGVIVLIFIGLIYAAFFSDYLANHYTQVWSTFTGCSFLFAATAGELFAACITVFIKHPYDVGDRICVDNKEMDVVKISLLYSVFKEVSSHQLVQIPNSTINSLWIKNVTRSKEFKEAITVSVSAGTSFDDLETLRALLTAFVAEHKRDFHHEIDLQLANVTDLKQLELKIEFEHKGNSASEVTRQHRRSKFLCAVVSAMRKVPIDGPGGGGGPGPGSKANPNYSVTITPEIAKEARDEADADSDAKRMFPKKTPRPAGEHEEAVIVGGPPGSSGLEILPSLARARAGAHTDDHGFYYQRL